jgi:hypothetical protein
MAKRQPGGVQEMALRGKPYQLAAASSTVRIVTDHWMAARCQVNPDLVRASRVQMGAKQVARIEPGEANEVRSRSPPGTDDRHPLSVARVARDGCIDRLAIARQVPPGQHRIAPNDAPLLERGSECPVRTFRLRHQQQP